MLMIAYCRSVALGLASDLTLRRTWHRKSRITTRARVACSQMTRA